MVIVKAVMKMMMIVHKLLQTPLTLMNWEHK
jgi:hypothetical protein